MKLLGKEIWDQHVKELRLTPSNAAAGGKYNGQDLKIFLRTENLEKLAPKIPDDEDRVPENEDEVRETRSEIIIKYMTCIDKLHTMCVAKSFVPYDVRGILSEFKEYFTKAYKLGLGLSATTKIHICWTHIPEWFEMQTTQPTATTLKAATEQLRGLSRAGTLRSRPTGAVTGSAGPLRAPWLTTTSALTLSLTGSRRLRRTLSRLQRSWRSTLWP